MNPPFFSKRLLGLLATLAFALSTAQAAIDFTDIAGTYTGNYSLNLDTSPISGRVTVTITVPPNGKKAVMEVVGLGEVATSPGVQVALLGKHTFRSNRAVSSNNVLYAMYLLIPAAPTKFSGSEKRFTFALSGNVSGTPAAVVYTVTANGKRLTVSGVGSLGGNPVNVSLSAKKSGKK